MTIHYTLVLQQNRLHWYGHMLQKEDDDWVKKCMEYEVEGPRPRGRPKRTWRKVVRDDCQARKMNKENAIDRCKWRKMTKDVRWSGWVWVGEFLLVPAYPGCPDQRPLNGCVCNDYNCVSHTWCPYQKHIRLLGLSRRAQTYIFCCLQCQIDVTTWT